MHVPARRADARESVPVTRSHDSFENCTTFDGTGRHCLPPKGRFLRNGYYRAVRKELFIPSRYCLSEEPRTDETSFCAVMGSDLIAAPSIRVAILAAPPAKSSPFPTRRTVLCPIKPAINRPPGGLRRETASSHKNRQQLFETRPLPVPGRFCSSAPASAGRLHGHQTGAHGPLSPAQNRSHTCGQQG